MAQLLDALRAWAAPAPAPWRDRGALTLAYASVRPWLVVALLAPMMAVADWRSALCARSALLIGLNVLVRLLYPSCYFPASASTRAWIGSPITARLIAFVAEFAQYEIWAVWYVSSVWSFVGGHCMNWRTLA